MSDLHRRLLAVAAASGVERARIERRTRRHLCIVGVVAGRDFAFPVKGRGHDRSGYFQSYACALRRCVTAISSLKQS